MLQAGMALIASTIERAQVEAMILLSQTSEMPGQQVSCNQLNCVASCSTSCEPYVMSLLFCFCLISEL